MPKGITCDLCNKPIAINGDVVEPYYFVEATYSKGKDDLRGLHKYNFRICTDCLETYILTPSDEAEKEFKEKLSD